VGKKRSSGASIPKDGVEDRGEVAMRNMNLGVTEAERVLEVIFNHGA
jgi:hypothetical protein